MIGGTIFNYQCSVTFDSHHQPLVWLSFPELVFLFPSTLCLNYSISSCIDIPTNKSVFMSLILFLYHSLYFICHTSHFIYLPFICYIFNRVQCIKKLKKHSLLGMLLKLLYYSSFSYLMMVSICDHFSFIVLYIFSRNSLSHTFIFSTVTFFKLSSKSTISASGISSTTARPYVTK